MADVSTHPGSQPAPWIEVTSSPGLFSWLSSQYISLAFTTYQSGKLFLLGRQPSGRLAVFERTFNRSMGLAVDGQSLWLATHYQVWRFENLLQSGEWYQEHDRLYVPKVGYTTGDIDVHDIAIDGSGRLIMVATSFGCLATFSDRASFSPIWHPPFLSKLVAEDRCHLNGLAMRDGLPRYVTAVSHSDVVDGWRDRRRDGGIVLEVPSGEVITKGLSMPHSPRFYRGQLWVLNSGTGFFGRINLSTGQFEPITFCPGYLRGLAFSGGFAIVGLSHSRHDKTFRDLPLDGELKQRDADARCGLLVIDLDSGTIVQWVRVEGVVRELYDVAVIPDVIRPMALGFKTEEIHRIIAIGEPAPLKTTPSDPKDTSMLATG